VYALINIHVEPYLTFINKIDSSMTHQLFYYVSDSLNFDLLLGIICENRVVNYQESASTIDATNTSTTLTSKSASTRIITTTTTTKTTAITTKTTNLITTQRAATKTTIKK
jgi:hypothetical protein